MLIGKDRSFMIRLFFMFESLSMVQNSTFNAFILVKFLFFFFSGTYSSVEFKSVIIWHVKRLSSTTRLERACY